MTATYDLDTPALLVDTAKLRRNISAMQILADQARVALRPHTKTHKSPVIAKMQVAAGAKGITVAKVGEAEVMAAAGFDDIFIAYPLIGEQKYERLLPLLAWAKITLLVDSFAGIEALANFFGPRGLHLPTLVEVDTGFKRTGAEGEDQALALAQAIDKAPGLVFQGLMEFGGKAYSACSEEDRRVIGVDEGQQLMAIAAKLAQAGLPAQVITTGSTPSMPFVAGVAGVTEARPGVYVFGDLKQAELGTLKREECALTVLATVVSNPVPGRFILDSGTKALSSDHYAAVTFGQLKDYPNATIVRASEEHGIIEAPDLRLSIGDKVEIIPNHACATTNMHDELYAVEGGQVVDVWPVLGRGKFR